MWPDYKTQRYQVKQKQEQSIEKEEHVLRIVIDDLCYESAPEEAQKVAETEDHKVEEDGLGLFAKDRAVFCRALLVVGTYAQE